MKDNYDKEKIEFLEKHLNEGHTKEELDEMFKQEVIEKDKKEKTLKFQERVEMEAKLSYDISGQRKVNEGSNVFEYDLRISRPCTLEAFVNLLALKSIESNHRTVVELDLGEPNHILIYIQNGEVECDNLDYIWCNKVIMGQKAIYTRDFMDRVERLIVVPLDQKFF